MLTVYVSSEIVQVSREIVIVHVSNEILTLLLRHAHVSDN